MNALDIAAVVGFGLATAVASGCGGSAAGVGARDAHDRHEGHAPARVRIAVLPPVWVAGGTALRVDAEAAVMRGLGARGGVTARRMGADALGGRSAPECAEDLACVCLAGAHERAEKAVVTRLAELGDTVLVRVSLVDVRAGTQEQVRQEVVRGASAARVAAAIERLGGDLARPFAPARDESGGAWYSSWAFWTVAGLLVAAAGTTATVLVVTQDGGRQPDGTITPP